MRFKIPVLNGINFVVISGVLYSLLNNFSRQVAQSSNFQEIPFSIAEFFIIIVIAFVIGFLLAFGVEFLFRKKSKDSYKSYVRERKHIPKSVSTKLLIIPSIVLLILITTLVLFMSGVNPFNPVGRTTVDSEVDTPPVAKEVPIEEEFVGSCEEKTYERVYNEAAGAYASEEKLVKTGHKCNEKSDCIAALSEAGREFKEENIDCTLN